jgi:hypothetical protein
MPNLTPDGRAYARFDTDVLATLTCPGLRFAVRMLSVSAGGALIRLDRLSSKVFEEEVFLFEITGIGQFNASKKWRRDTDIGVKFDLSEIERLRLSERLADRFAAARPAAARLATSSPLA